MNCMVTVFPDSDSFDPHVSYHNDVPQGEILVLALDAYSGASIHLSREHLAELTDVLIAARDKYPVSAPKPDLVTTEVSSVAL